MDDPHNYIYCVSSREIIGSDRTKVDFLSQNYKLYFYT